MVEHFSLRMQTQLEVPTYQYIRCKITTSDRAVLTFIPSHRSRILGDEDLSDIRLLNRSHPDCAVSGKKGSSLGAVIILPVQYGLEQLRRPRIYCFVLR